MRKFFFSIFLTLCLLPTSAQKVNFYFTGYCLANETEPKLETYKGFNTFKTVYFDLGKMQINYPISEDRRCCAYLSKDKVCVITDKRGNPAAMTLMVGGDKAIYLGAAFGTFCIFDDFYLLGGKDNVIAKKYVKGYSIDVNLRKLINLMKKYGFKIIYNKVPE